MPTRISTICLGMALLVACSSAQEKTAGPTHTVRLPGMPPPEAFAVCDDRTLSDSCIVRLPMGDLAGKCEQSRGGSQALVCVPDQGRQPIESARRPERLGGRVHQTTQSNGELELVAATQTQIAESILSEDHLAGIRRLSSNAIAQHATGAFPNPGNPNAIRQQHIDVELPLNPIRTSTAKPIGEFGWAVNGVPFDPGAAEFYLGNPRSGWQYEALSGAVALGLDTHHGHVQPSGKYHYHGLPTGLLDRLGVAPDRHSPRVGWAADGFPIYAIYGFADSTDTDSLPRTMQSSYRLKSGSRPVGEGQPGGVYDGTFTADYEYVDGAGDLDQCNGRFTVTPEFPDGTYAYFLTESWPVVPRCVWGITGRKH